MNLSLVIIIEENGYIMRIFLETFSIIQNLYSITKLTKFNTKTNEIER